MLAEWLVLFLRSGIVGDNITAEQVLNLESTAVNVLAVGGLNASWKVLRRWIPKGELVLGGPLLEDNGP